MFAVKILSIMKYSTEIFNCFFSSGETLRRKISKRFLCSERRFLVHDAVCHTYAGQAIPAVFLASTRHCLRYAEPGDRLHLGSPTAESSVLVAPSTAETSARGAPTDVRHQ